MVMDERNQERLEYPTAVKYLLVSSKTAMANTFTSSHEISISFQKICFVAQMCEW